MPAHYHITEVGKVQKDFIDCGGTVRSSTACVLQVWAANDEDHRLETTKLAGIMRVAGPLLESDDLPMEVEYEQGVISQYPIGGMEVTPSGLPFHSAPSTRPALHRRSAESMEQAVVDSTVHHRRFVADAHAVSRSIGQRDSRSSGKPCLILEADT